MKPQSGTDQLTQDRNREHSELDQEVWNDFLEEPERTTTDRIGTSWSHGGPERTGTELAACRGQVHVNMRASLDSWTGITHGASNWN